MRPVLVLFSFIFFLNEAAAQQSRFYFRKLTVAGGLNDGGVLALAQDNRGFMWFSTRVGLNRFDGNSVKSYSYMAGDSTSIPPSICRSMSADSSGGFLVGLEDGLLSYNEKTDRFTSVKALEGIWTFQIVPVRKNAVYVSTRSGLVKYDPTNGKLHFYKDDNNAILKSRIYYLEKQDSYLLMATDKGVFRMDGITGQLEKITFPFLKDEIINIIKTDAHKNYWVALRNKPGLIKISPDGQQHETYTEFLETGKNTIANFTSIITDKNGRIWVTTQLHGLLFYNSELNKFEQFLHDPLQVWTPSTNLHSSAYCDKEGIMWVGGNNGVNYFNPDKNLFRIIPVFNKDRDIRNRRVARVATQDHDGKLWFGTIDGLVKFDPQTNEYREWNNREGEQPMIHFNSIRGVLCDDENNIWIATGRGINKYLQKEDRMIFYGSKDSIPEVFYFSADKDRQSNLWFSTRDGDGFYYYSNTDKKFHSIRSVTGLNEFAGYGGRKFFEDSKGRYWLGFNGSGLGMYDPSTRKIRKWQANISGENSIAGNSVVDIVEDKKGIIWISTFTGLTSMNPATFTIKNYYKKHGLISNSVSALAVDAQNRLWIATGAGLQVLDSSKTYFTSFGLQHGLPSIEFPEHAASLLPGGYIMMPTQNGFVRFSPQEFTKENKQLAPFFTSFTIPGKPEKQLWEDEIKLSHDENFFTIGFAAINYENSTGTWYAYKLEGVDEDWKYTQNRFADYTKLPGGSYTFRVKASADRMIWNGPEKTVEISIATIFYKTWWFRIMLILLLILLLYFLYRNRIHQQRRLLELQSKAQLLEKEKVMVMYENLKQQLNPHFLFNSLTSLSGLIEADQKMAGSFLEQMSKIYRYILKNRDSELVSVKEELAFVQTYINLQKTRFKEGLQVRINVDEEELYKKIAPVTLQNLVENAMKHNIIDQETPLVIDITSNDGYLQVKNNLQRKSMVETSNKQGLASLQSLYQYLSERPMFIEETKELFSIRIPLI